MVFVQSSDEQYTLFIQFSSFSNENLLSVHNNINFTKFYNTRYDSSNQQQVLPGNLVD